MPFKGELSLTARKTRKYRKIDRLKDSHLMRGVIIANEEVEKVKEPLPPPAKDGFIFIPCPQFIVDRGSAQDIRCKSDSTYEKKLTRHEEKVIGEYIEELKFKKNEILQPQDREELQ